MRMQVSCVGMQVSFKGSFILWGSLTEHVRGLRWRHGSDLSVGLFHECLGLFCEYIGLFCQYVGLFCEYIGLFCQYLGLFRGLFRRYGALLLSVFEDADGDMALV